MQNQIEPGVFDEKLNEPGAFDEKLNEPGASLKHLMRSPGLAPGAPGLEWGPTSPTQPQEPDEPGASPGPLQEIADVVDSNTQRKSLLDETHSQMQTLSSKQE